MPRIEGDEFKPCRELHTKIGKDGCINLMTHCNHPRFELGCLDGKGECPDYTLARRILKRVEYIASSIEAR